MKLNVRELLEKILDSKVKVTIVDVQQEFVHLDKMKDGTWRFTITKSLAEGNK